MLVKVSYGVWLCLSVVVVMCVMIMGLDSRCLLVGVFMFDERCIMFIEFFIVMFCGLLVCMLILVWFR